MQLSVTDIRKIRDGLREHYMGPAGLNRRARGIPEPVIFHDRGFEEWEAVAITHALQHGVDAGLAEAIRRIDTFPEFKEQHAGEAPHPDPQ